HTRRCQGTKPLKSAYRPSPHHAPNPKLRPEPLPDAETPQRKKGVKPTRPRDTREPSPERMPNQTGLNRHAISLPLLDSSSTTTSSADPRHTAPCGTGSESHHPAAGTSPYPN